jgi:hypothetical protein
MSWGSDGVAQARLTRSVVTWPELDNYDKKRRFAQCGKRHGVASRVPAEKDGFAERLLAITAHQDVTYFTDRTRCLVLV